MYQTDMYEGLLAETITIQGHAGQNINAYYARPLGASWYGAAVIAQLTILAQGLLGAWLYLGMGLGAALPRPFMHILYGIVAVITLPAAWGYFGNLPDERVRSLAMAATCIFLWGILLRSGSTAVYLPPGL